MTDKHYLAFQPAAIEVEQTPPPLCSRLILWSIVILVLLGLAWAGIGRIDIVAVAPGKIVPAGKAKSVQAIERGIIQDIHVREGQKVQAGDALITLDATVSDADQQQTLRDLREMDTAYLLELAYQRYLRYPGQLLSRATLDEIVEESGEIADEVNLEYIHQTLLARIAEYESRLAALEKEAETLSAERDSADASLIRYQRTLPIIRERVDSVRGLYQRQLASRDQFLQLEQQHIEQQQAHDAEQARVKALSAGIARIRANISVLQDRETGQNLGALNDARHRSFTLRQSLVVVEQKQQQQILRAPIDGTVQQLQVHTVGGVVNPAQHLMSLIPRGATLEIEAFVRNRDIGFVHQGQTTAVKVDTFNFTRYGVLDGVIKTLSSDAVTREGSGLVYPAVIVLSSDSISVDNKQVPLSSGMAVTVEIKTGTRRILEFFLSPLLRFTSESIRER